MKTLADITLAKKTQAVINSLPKLQSSGESTFLDNTTIETQLKENTEGEELQGKFEPIQESANNIALPDNLKTGIEKLSSYSTDDVKVHYNSAQPAQLNAKGYAQGTDIHVAPRQERNLPHEGWHVVQQKQGRLKPTMQIKEGIPVNDNAGLEKEADKMWAKAMGLKFVPKK